MKSILTFLLAVTISLAGGQTLRGQTYDPDYLDGNIYLKLQDTSTIVPDPVAIPALGTIFSTFGVDTIYRAFTSQDPLVNKIYRLEFSIYPTTGQLLSALQGLAFVDYAEQVPLITAFGTSAYVPNDLDAQQWYLTTINAAQAWDLARGDAQVVVAIVDNAVLTSHEDLAGILWVNPGEIPNNLLDDDLNGYTDDVNGYDVADFDNDPNPPTTGTGWDHGTHCAGIAAAETDNNKGIASIGFGIRVMSVKSSLSLTNGNTLERAYEGVDYAVSANADIISMSWGGSGNSLTGQRVMTMASLNNIVLVAAAGNNNDSVPVYPGAYPETIGVGATSPTDERSSFSNYGSYIDLMAPGNNIYSSIATSTTSYANLSGTSMACPLVAGLAGLILSADPSLTPVQVKDVLINGCENIDAVNPNYIGKLGAGRINAFNSLSQLVVSASEPAGIRPVARLFPNPANDQVRLQIRDSHTAGEFRLIDLQGRELIRQRIPEGNNQQDIDLSALAPGLYLAEVTVDATRQMIRLMVR
jgi:subtilisin family serine protease